jgi:hypothetical protein
MNRARAVMAALCVCVTQVYADQEKQVDQQQAQAGQPEIELLEFLGEWSEDDRQWLEMQQQQEARDEDDADKTASQNEVNDHE